MMLKDAGGSYPSCPSCPCLRMLEDAGGCFRMLRANMHVSSLTMPERNYIVGSRDAIASKKIVVCQVFSLFYLYYLIEFYMDIKALKVK